MAVSKHHASDSLRAGARRSWRVVSTAVLHPVQSGLAKLVFALALLVGLYALAGFVLAPRLLRSYLIDYAQREYGRELSLGTVRVNPFKFWVELNDLALPDADRQRLLGFGRLFVDFEGFASLWERALVFREITLERPQVRVVVRPDGEVNLADLAGKSKPAKPESSTDEEELIALWIQALTVEQGAVDFIDQTRPHAFERTLAPLGFSLRNFRTSAAGGRFDLSAALGEGSELSWHGKISVSPRVVSSGQLTLSAFPLRMFKEYAGEALTFGISSGTLDLQAGYDVSLGKDPRAEVKLPSIAMSNLTLQSRDRSATVEIPSIAVADSRLGFLKREVEVGRIVMQGLSTRAIRQTDGSFNLLGMLSTRQTEPATAPAAPSAGKKPAAHGGAPAWSAKLGSFELQHAHLRYEDHVPTSGAEFELAPVDVSAKDLSLDLAKPVAMTFSGVLKSGGKLSAQGTVTPWPFAVDVAAHLDGLEIVPAAPYITDHAQLLLRNGQLDWDGKVALRWSGGQTKLSARGDLVMRGVRTLDNVQRQDFFGFDRLEVKQVQYDVDPPWLSIEQVSLRKAYLRLLLRENQELNVASVLSKPKSAAASRDAAAAPVAQPAASSQPAKASEPVVEQTLPIRVKKVAIQGMRVNFSDYFSKPNFIADIQQLTGTLQNLSSDPRARATLDLKGKLGANSSVSVSGKLQPFAYDKQSDVQLVVKNISLPIFNPYSGKYAGYNIARGELTTDIHYKLVNRKLEALHKIRIDQLEWGAETESKEAASLPVKLATVLLRDRHGVIHLDIPVEGTLDDPEFDVWPVIWQVVGNVLLKAVMAPFDLIGALFEGSEKARYIDFAPGSADLSEPSRKALDALRQVLREKTELLVDVPIATVPELDRQGLIEQNLQQRIAASLGAKAKGGGAPAFDTLPAAQQVRVLSGIYEELTGRRMPEPGAAPPGQPATAPQQKLDVETVRSAVLGEIKLSDEELTRLGRRRGEAIEAALMGQGELDATRVLLSTEGKATAEQDKVRFELVLH